MQYFQLIGIILLILSIGSPGESRVLQDISDELKERLGLDMDSVSDTSSSSSEEGLSEDDDIINGIEVADGPALFDDDLMNLNGMYDTFNDFAQRPPPMDPTLPIYHIVGTVYEAEEEDDDSPFSPFNAMIPDLNTDLMEDEDDDEESEDVTEIRAVNTIEKIITDFGFFGCLLVIIVTWLLLLAIRVLEIGLYTRLGLTTPKPTVNFEELEAAYYAKNAKTAAAVM